MLIASPVRCCDCERKSKRSSLSSRPGFIATSTPNPCSASPVSGPCLPRSSSHSPAAPSLCSNPPTGSPTSQASHPPPKTPDASAGTRTAPSATTTDSCAPATPRPKRPPVTTPNPAPTTTGNTPTERTTKNTPSPPRTPHLLQPETPRGKEPQTSRPHPRQTTHQHNLSAPARRNKIPSEPTHPSTNHNLTSQLRFPSWRDHVHGGWHLMRMLHEPRLSGGITCRVGPRRVFRSRILRRIRCPSP